MNPLLALAIQETPGLIAAFKLLFHGQNQDIIVTDEEVIAAFKSAFDSSLAKDDNWLAIHKDGV